MELLWLNLVVFCILLNGMLDYCYAKRGISIDLINLEKLVDVHLESGEMSMSLEILQSATTERKGDYTFNLFAPKGFGLAVYVKSAHLRIFWKQRMMEKGYIPQCRDYLLFNGLEKVCHEVKESDLRLKPPGLVGPRIINNNSGHIQMQIHTDYFSSIVPTNNKTFKLVDLILTPYADCWSVRDSKSEKDWRRCLKEDSFSCIHSSLYCDGEINCAFDGGFRVDENNCTLIQSKISLSNRSIPAPKDKAEDSQYQIRQYFVPTGFIFFIIWGIITLVRKCYKCYRTDFTNSKDDLYY